jgi:hypothetical protein
VGLAVLDRRRCAIYIAYNDKRICMDF